MSTTLAPAFLQSQIMSNKRILRYAGQGQQMIKNRSAIRDMLKDIVLGRYSISRLNLYLFIAGFLYILLPADLLPDIIPIAGWIDDGMVFLFLSKRLLAETKRYVQYRLRS